MYLIYLILGEKELTDHNKAFMLKKKKYKQKTLHCLLMLHLR